MNDDHTKNQEFGELQDAEKSDLCICSADQSELGYAVEKAQLRAQETGGMVSVYSLAGLFWMADGYHNRGKLVARVYPGGRVELKGRWQDGV